MSIDDILCIPEFLKYALEQPFTQSQFMNVAYGQMMKEINTAIIKNSQVTLPGINEQKIFLKKIHKIEKTLDNRVSIFEYDKLYEST